MRDPNAGRPGYKETRVGWIPEEWDAKPLGELTKPGKPIVYGIVQAGPDTPGGVPYIRSTDVGPRLVQPTQLLRTSPEIATRHRRSVVAEGDLVFSLRGEIGAISEVGEELSGANLTQGTARIAVDRSVSPAYVRYALSGYRVRRLVDAWAKGSTFREITIEDLRRVPVPVPGTQESGKIAEILCTWDAAIEGSTDLLEAKKRQKRALMQQLLTGRRRLPGCSGDWKRGKLCHLFERVTRRNTTGCQNVLTISGSRGLVEQQGYFRKRIAAEDASGYFLLKRGEFAYNKSKSKGYPLGAIKMLRDYEEGVVSTLNICCRLREGAANRDFARLYFDAGRLDHELYRIAEEGARHHGLLNVTPSDFLSTEVVFPERKEQDMIAGVLLTAESQVSVLEAKRAALQRQKKALMQKLLTGQVRVKV